MSTRTDLANAVTEIDGITGYEYVTGNIDPGSAYPRLDRVEYPDPFAGVAYWDVVVVLPQDLADAEAYMEANLNSIKEALDPHLIITAARPQRLNIDGVGTIPALFISGWRESDI